MPEVQKLPAPTAQARVETGVVQFGDDWPGYFFRGDSTLDLPFAAEALAGLIDALKDSGMIRFSEGFLLTPLVRAGRMAKACHCHTPPERKLETSWKDTWLLCFREFMGENHPDALKEEVERLTRKVESLRNVLAMTGDVEPVEPVAQIPQTGRRRPVSTVNPEVGVQRFRIEFIDPDATNPDDGETL